MAPFTTKGGLLTMLVMACWIGTRSVEALDYREPDDTDEGTHTMHGVHATNAVCKTGAGNSKTHWENNIGHTTNWKTYYNDVKDHCDENRADYPNPPWSHPFPCNPYGHLYYDGHNDVYMHGDFTDHKKKYDTLMQQLATAAANTDNVNGPLLMCEWFAGDRDWGGEMGANGPKSAALARGPAAARPAHWRPCGCYFSPWEDEFMDDNAFTVDALFSEEGTAGYQRDGGVDEAACDPETFNSQMNVGWKRGFDWCAPGGDGKYFATFQDLPDITHGTDISITNTRTGKTGIAVFWSKASSDYYVDSEDPTTKVLWGGRFGTGGSGGAAAQKDFAVHDRIIITGGNTYSKRVRGTFYYHRCTGTCDKVRTSMCDADGDCGKVCSDTEKIACTSAGDCPNVCSVSKATGCTAGSNHKSCPGRDEDGDPNETCAEQTCVAQSCVQHHADAQHDCGVNGRSCVCMTYPEP